MKILIADDHAIMREGVKQIIKSLPEKIVIEESIDGNNAFLKICNNKYDLAILDISMPGMSGFDILQGMKDRHQQTPVLIFSFYPQTQYAIHAFKMGASGYLSKDCAFEELGLAIRKILSGGIYISASLAERLLLKETNVSEKQNHEKLSEREFQIMIKLAKGKSVTEIASEIFISDKTVSTYRVRLMKKMNFKNNAEIIFYALKNNLIEKAFSIKSTDL